ARRRDVRGRKRRGRRLPGGNCEGVGSRGVEGGGLADATGPGAIRNYSGERRRRAGEDGDAVQVWIRRAARKRQTVDVVDCTGRCGGDIEIVSGADTDSRCGELCANFWGVERRVAASSYEC